jgi:glutaredoxin
VKKNVKVFGVPNCVKCNATKRWLERKKIPYEYVDVSQSLELTEAIRQAAVDRGEPAVMPFVEVHTDLGGEPVQWFDMRPDLLQQHVGVAA